MNSSLGYLDAAEDYYGYPNDSDSYENAEEYATFGLKWTIWLVITFTICCIGVVGNGCIIWLLVFQIKRNGFTTFILNLAIADFGFLMSIVTIFIYRYIDFYGGETFNELCVYFIQVMYINTHFLMTAISIDRCVAVLFPIWHRCSRPKHLSPAVCAFLWICSFLFFGIIVIMEFKNVLVYSSPNDLLFLVSDVVCFPLITLSTGVLFVKVCLKSNQRNQGRVLLTILMTFLCFLILAFPLTVLIVITSFCNIADDDDHNMHLDMCGLMLSCLNSSINPVIYFLAGRKKGARSKRSMKVILQNAFKEAEAT